MSVASEPVLDVALTVADGLESRDLTTLKSAFVSNGYAIDPVVSSLRPPLTTWFSIFKRLCTDVSSGDIYVNADGSATGWDCYGFYEGFMDDPPDPNFSLRHIQMEGDLAKYLINRIDAETLEAYPAETSDAIGFPQSQEAAILNQAQTALRFVPDYVEAWESGDPGQILDLYAADGVRDDTFAGLRGDRGATIAWLSALDREYSEITVDVDSVQGSDLGPSAEYRLTLSNSSESCVMRMASVWDLNEEGLVISEAVFYHPDTIFDCGWEPTDS